MKGGGPMLASMWWSQISGLRRRIKVVGALSMSGLVVLAPQDVFRFQRAVQDAGRAVAPDYFGRRSDCSASDSETFARAVLALNPHLQEESVGEPTTPEFRVAPGTELHKRFDWELRVFFDGQSEQDLIAGCGHVELIDSYAEFSAEPVKEDHAPEELGTRPLSFERRFEKLESEWKLGAGELKETPEAFDVRRQLLYRPLTFEWDGSSKDYIARWKRIGAFEVAPEGLFADCDYWSLLRSRNRASFDPACWEVEYADLGPAFAPAGWEHIGPNLWAEFGEGLVKSGLAEDFADFFGLSTAECQFREPSEPGEPGQVEVELSRYGRLDLSESANRMAQSLGANGAEARVETDLEGSAILKWDMRAGHFKAFKAQVTGTARVELVIDLRGRGTPVRYDVDLGIEGRWTGLCSEESDQ